MENCTIVSNANYTTGTGGKGVHQTGGTIRNCIIYTNGGSTVAGDYTTTGGTIQYSLAPELTPGAPNYNLNGNPQFVNPATDDYTLKKTSPCIDAGMDIAGMTVDLAGAPRPWDGNGDGISAMDMGAYEAPTSWQGSVFRFR